GGSGSRETSTPSGERPVRVQHNTVGFRRGSRGEDSPDSVAGTRRGWGGYLCAAHHDATPLKSCPIGISGRLGRLRRRLCDGAGSADQPDGPDGDPVPGPRRASTGELAAVGAG